MTLRRIILFVFLLFCMNSTPLVQAAELLSQFHPFISVKGEYNDNLTLIRTDKKEDFLTTVQPGIKFSNMDETGGVDLNYALGAVFYSKNSHLNYISHDASLNVKYLTPQHINFYLKESFIRSDTPREREYLTMIEDNRYVLATKTDRTIYWRNVAAPTLEYQFGPENRLGVNYRNNTYQTEDTNGQNSRENYINPFFAYWFNRQNGIALDYGFTRGDFEKDPDLTGHRASARFTHRFRPTSSIFAEYAFSRRTFESPGVDYDIHEPTVGVTHALTSSLSGSAQVGYFRKEVENGPIKDGFSYKGELRNVDPRTTFQISLQGGYTEDFFTSENLGFNRYHRLTGSLTHRLDRRISIGGFGSFERAEFDLPDHRDSTWGIGGRASYMPLKWLTLALEVSHKDRQSDVSDYEYTENRGLFTVTATY